MHDQIIPDSCHSGSTFSLSPSSATTFVLENFARDVYEADEVDLRMR